MNQPEPLEVVDDICRFHPRGECSLVEFVELINGAIRYCRDRHIGKLLVNATDLLGVPVPNLIDRFLLVEELAHEAKNLVVVALVIDTKYIHPEKFGVKVGADLGLTLDVYSSEAHALEWLSRFA